LLCSLKLTDNSAFSPEITMAKVNLSGMSVEALMDLGSGLTKCFLSVVPRLKSSWRGWGHCRGRGRSPTVITRIGCRRTASQHMLIHAWCQHTQGMVLHPVLLIAERLFYSAQLRDRFCDTATDRRLVYQLDIRYRATPVRHCFPIIEAPQAQVV